MLDKPYASNISKNAVYIDSFGGINERLIIGDNEFSEAVNMSDRDLPAMSTRKPLTIFKTEEEKYPINSFAINNDVMYALSSNGTFYYGENAVSLDGAANNKLLRNGNSLFMYPKGTVISLPSTTSADDVVKFKDVAQVLKRRETFSFYVYFYPCIISGVEKTQFSSNSPENPTVGMYWSNYSDSSLQLCTEVDAGTNAATWKSVESDGIAVLFLDDMTQITKEGISEHFRDGDAIEISGAEMSCCNGSFVVNSVTTDLNNNGVLVLNGRIDSVYSDFSHNVVLEKKMPKISHCVGVDNRLWGCYCGYDNNGNLINEIYGSALGRPDVWYRFDNTLQQSYAASIVSDGAFTGIGIIGGHPAFFKENCIHKLYGSNPSNYAIQTIDCLGVKEGCDGSVCVINGITYYMSKKGIMAISDGYPTLISNKIDFDGVKSVACANINNELHVVFLKDGEINLYIYNPTTGIWHNNNCIDLPAASDGSDIRICFCKDSLMVFCRDGNKIEEKRTELLNRYNELSQLTGLEAVGALTAKLEIMIILKTGMYKALVKTKGNLIFFGDEYPIPTGEGFPFAESEKENPDEMKWEITTGAFGYSYTNFKVPSSVGIRILLDAGSNCNIEAEYDSNGIWEYVDNLIGDERTCVRFVNMKPYQCDHFRLRLSGIGKVSIVNMMVKYTQGGSNNYD